MIVYVIYGKTGGIGEALAITDALMEAIQLEIGRIRVKSVNRR